MAAMVAYNLMLSVFPFALLLLFVFGQILQSGDLQQTLVRDLQELFPSTERETLSRALDRVREGTTEIGLVAIVAGIWIGASFWGAMDTAFCRIYHVECRGWWAQKRFSLVMLVTVTIFLAASVLLPALEAVLLSGVDDLPLGLSNRDWLIDLVLLGGGLLISFLILSVIYWVVPKGTIPWRGVWPGALFVTVAAGIANVIFPYYLVNLSAIGEFGRTVSFVLIALIWFYAIALGLLAGGVINALRYELHDTGTLKGMTREFAAVSPEEVEASSPRSPAEPPPEAYDIRSERPERPNGQPRAKGAPEGGDAGSRRRRSD